MKSKGVYGVKAKVPPSSIPKNIRPPNVLVYPYILVTLPTIMFEDRIFGGLVGSLSEYATIQIGLN